MKTKCRACKRTATHIATTILGDIPYCSYHANKRLRENICVGKITKMTPTKTEQYQCQSYYDELYDLRDCTCGKCGKTDKQTEV